MSRLEILREQMNTVEKQYEKNKPLVNLVDNMVKLGALYRTESLQWNDNPMTASRDNLNRLHANQRNQERFLIADDQNEWNKYNSRQIELHVSSIESVFKLVVALWHTITIKTLNSIVNLKINIPLKWLQQKVQQLYELDEILQEESDNLHLLQRDKEDIEGALAELNRKFATDHVQPESFVDTQKIQHSLEAELSKIHSQLAINSRVIFPTSWLHMDSKSHTLSLILIKLWSLINHTQKAIELVNVFEPPMRHTYLCEVMAFKTSKPKWYMNDGCISLIRHNI